MFNIYNIGILNNKIKYNKEYNIISEIVFFYRNNLLPLYFIFPTALFYSIHLY